MKTHASLAILAACLVIPATCPAASGAAGPAQSTGDVTVELEEEVYTFEPAQNGAGPMWCSGSTCMARIGETVYASGLETIPGVAPLNNCRWTLFRRDKDGWKKAVADSEGRTREPSPIAVYGDGRLFLSANPTQTQPGTYSGPAQPELIEFRAPEAEGTFQKLVPEWKDHAKFTEHSYRSLAADPARGELILLQNIDHSHAEWTFRNSAGQWGAKGKLEWPWGSDYPKPESIRLCYPNVALRNGAVYFVGVSDIIEPNPEWRKFKQELTGQAWDYEFRRLFYTWSPAINSSRFQPWLEIANREKTCGWITPGDLWVAAGDRVNIIWTERALDERLRPKFFPGERQSHTLHLAVVHNGNVERRLVLLRAEEGGPSEIPGRARFFPTSSGRLFVVVYVSGADAQGRSVSENRLLELDGEGRVASAQRIPLKHPFVEFFTATPRAGSKPTMTLDLLGTRAGDANRISYARVSLR